MTTDLYKRTKLAIFEKSAGGLITESQRDDLLFYLEKKKEETDLTPDKIEDFFDELEEMYPDLEDDIEKLAKKIKKQGDSSDDDDSDDNDSDEDSSDDVSEAVLDLMDKIDLINDNFDF